MTVMLLRSGKLNFSIYEKLHNAVLSLLGLCTFVSGLLRRTGACFSGFCFWNADVTLYPQLLAYWDTFTIVYSDRTQGQGVMCHRFHPSLYVPTTFPYPKVMDLLPMNWADLGHCPAPSILQVF